MIAVPHQARPSSVFISTRQKKSTQNDDVQVCTESRYLWLVLQIEEWISYNVRCIAPVLMKALWKASACREVMRYSGWSKLKPLEPVNQSLALR